MEAAKFTEILGADFYTGVPDAEQRGGKCHKSAGFSFE